MWLKSAMSKRKTFHILAIVLVSLCISSALIPYLLIWNAVPETPPTITSQFRKPSRKALDVEDRKETEEEQEIKSHVIELKRITLSVRNELRELEEQRVKIVQETEHHKSNLYKLQDSLANSKKQLQIAQAELSKVSHEIYSNTQRNNCITRTEAPPIFILPNSPAYKPHPPLNYSSQCNRYQSSCHNHSRCPLTKSFKVYLYSIDSSQLVTKLKDYLLDINSLTNNPEEACLFVVVLGPTLIGAPHHIIQSLSHWKEEGGVNHVIVNLNNDVKLNFDLLRSTLVQSYSLSTWRHGHDILIPPITNSIDDQSLWKMMPSLVPAYRKYYIYFEGYLVDSDSNYIIWLHRLRDVLSLNNTVIIKTTCIKNGLVGGAGGWGLCEHDVSCSVFLKQSTFSLIPLRTEVTNLANQIRLVESLRYGAIPVIIGLTELPFETILDWSSVCLRIPSDRFHEIHYIMRSVSHDQLQEMRRIGRFYWETYFSTPLQILKASIAIMRFRLFHLPPVSPSFKPKRLKQYGNKSIFKSPILTANTSIYRYNFWNRPPGPFFMYPQTPDIPPPISGSQYASMDANSLRNLPPHIIQAGGITGPYFQNYLLGNIPDEYFTVVMLTYRREEVVKESIERLRQLDHLAKVILVWNDPDNSPFLVEWPSLSVPLEVCDIVVVLYSLIINRLCGRKLIV